MNSEHVEVLRRMRSEWPLATDEVPALDAAIAALSAQQPAADPYRVFFERAMDTAHEAMEYIQTHAEQFGASPGDDKLAIVCREFLKAQKPAAVDEAMVERALAAYGDACIGRASSRVAMKCALLAALAAKQGGDHA